MTEKIEVNLPRLGNCECAECGAPGGIHQGTCPAVWQQLFNDAPHDIEREKLRREYVALCKRHQITPRDLRARAAADKIRAALTQEKQP
jgi:hypothetical protein